MSALRFYPRLFLLVSVFLVGSFAGVGCQAGITPVEIPAQEIYIPILDFNVGIPNLQFDPGGVSFRGNRIETIQGSGVVVTETQPIAGVNRITLSGIGDVRVIQGNDESLRFTTDDNIRPYLETEIRGSELIIGLTEEAMGKTFQPSESIRFEVYVADVAALSVSGAGNVFAAEITTDGLVINLSGAGDINLESLEAEQVSLNLSGVGEVHLAGRVANQEINLSGMGSYRAPDLKTRQASLNVSGVGSAIIWVTDNLDVNLSGLGDVQYYGRPVIDRHTSGLGRLTQLGIR